MIIYIFSTKEMHIILSAGSCLITSELSPVFGPSLAEQAVASFFQSEQV